MENDAIVFEEVAEEIVKTGLSKGFKVAAGIGLGAIVVGVTYKYAAKPVIAKIKAKRSLKNEDHRLHIIEDEEIVEERKTK